MGMTDAASPVIFRVSGNSDRGYSECFPEVILNQHPPTMGVWMAGMTMLNQLRRSGSRLEHRPKFFDNIWVGRHDFGTPCIGTVYLTAEGQCFGQRNKIARFKSGA